MMITPIPSLKTPVHLIGISGKAGSGKDTVANHIYQTYDDVFIVPFAQALKNGLATLFGIPRMDFYTPEKKAEINIHWDKSPRELAQYFGTEIFRQFDENFWVKRLNGYLNNELVFEIDMDQFTEPFFPNDTVVIPDVRFQNEYDYIIDNGGIVIFLERDGADGSVGIPGHSSEAGISNISTERTFTYVNNGTIEELYIFVETIVDGLGIKNNYFPL